MNLLVCNGWYFEARKRNIVTFEAENRMRCILKNRIVVPIRQFCEMCYCCNQRAADHYVLECYIRTAYLGLCATSDISSTDTLAQKMLYETIVSETEWSHRNDRISIMIVSKLGARISHNIVYRTINAGYTVM